MVSVVVATYRRDAELRRALVSLARQSYPSVEVILVDDNGTPDWNRRVAETVAAFRAEWPAVPVRLIVNRKHLGSAGARNAGIAAAGGAYTTFLDDDDEYLPDKVARQVVFMEQGRYDYSITDLVLYRDDGRRVGCRTRTYIQDTSPEALRLYHLKYHMTGTDTLMFRTDHLRRLGGFDPIDIGDEFYLVHKAIEAGGRFGYLPGCDVKAYVHTDGTALSSSAARVAGEQTLYAHKKQYFAELARRDVRYIRMRHCAVLAFAHYRARRYGAFLLYGCRAVLTAPVACLRMLAEMRGER